MHGHSISWLLLSVVGLAALVSAELHYQVGTGSGRQVASNGAPTSATVQVPLFSLADREKLSDTITRPLFMPNRQPEVASVPDAPQAESQAPPPKANRYALSAIIIVDDKRVALLTDTATGGLSRVREGESLAGWQVEEIREESAVLSNGGVREELALRTFGPPIAAPKRRRLPAGAQRQSPAQSAKAPADSKSPKRPRRPKRGPRQVQPFPGSQSN